MHTKLVRITPEMAQVWLKKNSHNRPLRKGMIKRYAKDMLEGRWKLHHQGIAFNCDGTLVDGQHRLEAIVESGVAVEMNVTEGVSLDSQIAVDDHGKRNPFDALVIAGQVERSISRDHVSIATAMMRQGSSNFYKTSAGNKQIIAEFINANFEIIDFAVELFSSKAKRRLISQATVMAPIARAAYKHDRERLRVFWETLYSGEMRADDDVAAITLRNFLLMNQVSSSGGSGRAEIYKKTERCLKAFLENVQLRKCTSLEVEAFPIPSDSVNS